MPGSPDIQAFALVVLPIAAALLWIAARRTTPLHVRSVEAMELAIFTWFGLLALIAAIYFRTH